MSKLSIPQDGISSSVNPGLENSIGAFQEAINACDFDVPSGQPYQSWIYGLRKQLEDCQNEVRATKDKINQLDDQLDSLEQETHGKLEAMSDINIEPRQRLIKI